MRLRLLQPVVEADPLVVPRVDDLADADVGVEQVGTLQRRLHPDRGAPAVRHQDHLALAVALADVLGDLDRIVDVARNVHGLADRVGVIFDVRLAGAALVLVHDREVLLDRPLELPESASAATPARRGRTG